MTILLVDGIMAIRLFVVVLRPKSTVMILHYFMIYNQESMGPGRDRTRDPWICSQTRTCCQTRYRLRYAARSYGHSCQNVSCCSLSSQQCLKFTKASLPFFNDTSRSFLLNNKFEPVHEISNKLVCATSKASDQPAHTRSLIRAFACRLSTL